ncbi:hypothetical protein phiTE_028 [Pectobacterium phage phiTE]|uniref:Uncharacterized protein n=2 Tax=root TaxID=1 RepID=K9L3Q0_9CAUD|nr:hypothetical protein phiTE_028 [Pectobacterium phage phiTE]AEZ66194.1 hypothetical protein phiTE_028 [Pectobacterium phage phiTE]
MYQRGFPMTEDLSKLSMSHLLALRDLGRDDLRRVEKHKADLEQMLASIKLEIEIRGKRAAE